MCLAQNLAQRYRAKSNRWISDKISKKKKLTEKSATPIHNPVIFEVS